MGLGPICKRGEGGIEKANKAKEDFQRRRHKGEEADWGGRGRARWLEQRVGPRWWALVQEGLRGKLRWEFDFKICRKTQLSLSQSQTNFKSFNLSNLNNLNSNKIFNFVTLLDYFNSNTFEMLWKEKRWFSHYLDS